MKRGVSRAWRRITVPIALVAVGGLVMGLASCFLFNVPPEAGFTIGPSTAGQAPFTVTLSAAPSSDPDGDIETYTWDFGDGGQGAGGNVAHTYTAPGTYTIVLIVEDEYGATGQASKTVYVTAPEPAGPTAQFTASPSSGTSPLTVTFNAAASTYEAGTIVAYDWGFGDGGTGFGQTATHTYFSAGTQTFTVTLTVRGSDGKLGSTTGTVRVTAPGGGTTPTPGAPSARFDIDESIGVAPLQVNFDPQDSEAEEGRVIILYTWSYGDGAAESDVNPAVMDHVYTTKTPSETFSVTLVVLDNAGASDSITKTVKAYNFRPVAGFDIINPPGGETVADDTQFYATAAAAWAAGEVTPALWLEDDVVYGDLQNDGLLPIDDVVVVIRSREIPDARWFNLDGTLAQDALRTSTTSATSSTAPGAPADYDDHNFSYDPEGQTWAVNEPGWFPDSAGEGWGVRYLYINWGDGSAEERVEYAEDDWSAFGGDVVVAHPYDITADGTVVTITVTAEDWLGYKSAPFSRRVTLKVGTENAGED
ncbi:MAG: PKD domain-containing protein [Candidatus Bipolaricaulota bacterium]